MIYHRVIPTGKFITEKDYIKGFGVDNDHYLKVIKARQEYNKKYFFERFYKKPLALRDDFNEVWDARIGVGIDGVPFNTRHHEWHNKKLIEQKTNKVYVIDAVFKHHYFGFYYSLLIREENSESHGIISWENINCYDPTILNDIVKSHKRFKFSI